MLLSSSSDIAFASQGHPCLTGITQLITSKQPRQTLREGLDLCKRQTARSISASVHLDPKLSFVDRPRYKNPRSCAARPERRREQKPSRSYRYAAEQLIYLKRAGDWAVFGVRPVSLTSIKWAPHCDSLGKAVGDLQAPSLFRELKRVCAWTFCPALIARLGDLNCEA
jgi:hypothetical protein